MKDILDIAEENISKLEVIVIRLSKMNHIEEND